jgi:cellulose synthase/poly-beta-1,6-N-acetylglucosamine synthase-like glycosyltransferase
MFIVYVLRWFLLAMEVLIVGPILYLSVISISAIVTQKKRQMQFAQFSSAAETICSTFAILIPAHNEQDILGTLLDSLAHLDYPKDKYTVHVVADNCTDNTANVVRATGWVHVHERFDKVKRGKGYALNWLLHELEENQLIYDAYIVLDADSVVEPTFLQSMARGLAQGARAMQACNTVLNVSDSPSTALRFIALTLMNHVRPLGRNGLGSSSTLTGNGMCLSRTLLLRYPWQAYSLSEDYQYYLTLVRHGERVRYVPEAVVRSQMPTTFAQMRTQDVRWESSEGGQKTWSVALQLLESGLRSRDFARIEAVAELLTPPLSFLVSCCLLAFIASLFLRSLPGLLLSLILVGGLMCYIGTALYLVRPPRKVYMAFLHAPGFMLWKLWVYFVLRRSPRYASKWERTSRVISIK